MKNKPESWTGELIGRMHNEGVKHQELAAELGFTKNYLSMILVGHRKPPQAEEKLNAAFERLLAKRAE